MREKVKNFFFSLLSKVNSSSPFLDVSKAEGEDSGDGMPPPPAAPSIPSALPSSAVSASGGFPLGDAANCPVCYSRIKEAFITSCGHSFCYKCITHHIEASQNCPVCRKHIDRAQVENFLIFFLDFFFFF
jgi:hypothetical protein